MRIKNILNLSAARCSCRRSFLFCQLAVFFIWVFSPAKATAQVSVNYNLFSKDPLGGIRINVPTPYQIQPVQSLTISPVNQTLPPNGNASPGTAGPMGNPQPYLPTGMPVETAAQQVVRDADMEREQTLNNIYRKALEKEEAIHPYREALARLSKMNPNNFSLSHAVYEVENAYLDNKLSLEGFSRALAFRVDQVRQILKTQGLSSKSSLSVNYAIQQLYEHPNIYYEAKTQLTHTVAPFKYDLEDYMGEKDYTNLFASKLLAKGSGQCHSLPLVYLMVAEQFGAKAWLSLAPSHSFIQFMDNRGRLLDFETTNGNIVSGSWVAGSGYINGKALRNKTYLDTLSRRQLYARCLSDLLLGYLNKFEYDDLAQEIRSYILRIDPSNITVLLVDANLKSAIAWREIKAAGLPKPADLPKYPKAFKAYQEMKEAINRVNDVGYQDMPSDAYQEWLKSIETEKKRLATEKLQERVKLQTKTQRSSLHIQKN